ncbi:hypothetical protein KY290_026044 [Solanum tuberosum]|uniref:Uncharacterized protein n=1 Tax=Solanum tuberosum TaxID=4113 RepID=A0ABQ7UVA1_SOLTU|nr:hypothetical protein KY290_026044 [Solanum tuberosum]
MTRRSVALYCSNAVMGFAGSVFLECSLLPQILAYRVPGAAMYPLSETLLLPLKKNYAILALIRDSRYSSDDEDEKRKMRRVLMRMLKMKRTIQGGGMVPEQLRARGVGVGG